MTNGSSQGLFVIVAVVIFGIFIVISYLLFRDKLQTGLASIFTDSLIESKEKININSNLLLNPNFNGDLGWKTFGIQENKNTNIINNGDGSITIDKYGYHDGTNYDRAYLVNDTIQNKIVPEFNTYYSATVEIFIEELENKNSSAFNTFLLRTVLNTGIANNFGQVDLNTVEKGKWVKLEVKNVKISTDTNLNESISFLIALSADTKGKIHIKNPTLVMNKY